MGGKTKQEQSIPNHIARKVKTRLKNLATRLDERSGEATTELLGVLGSPRGPPLPRRVFATKLHMPLARPTAQVAARATFATQLRDEAGVANHGRGFSPLRAVLAHVKMRHMETARALAQLRDRP